MVDGRMECGLKSRACPAGNNGLLVPGIWKAVDALITLVAGINELMNTSLSSSLTS